MFADSLLDSHFTGRAQRGWTTLTSFALQTLVVAALLMLPLLYTEGFPNLRLIAPSAPIGVPQGPQPAAQHHAVTPQNQSNMFHGIVVAPPTIPIHIAHIDENSTPLDAAPCTICVPGATGTMSSTNSVIDSIGTSATAAPPPPAPVARPPRVSHMMEGNLIYKVQPVYPTLPRAARIQGQVLLRAFISRTGTIENLQAISGHPMLIPAALDAVRQWRYRPYILNGEPVEVETQITVNFSLSGG